MNAPSKPGEKKSSPDVPGQHGDTIGERSVLGIDSAIFKDVRVAIKVKLGEAQLTVEELMALRSGSVLPLDCMMNELVDLYLNESLIARGEIVAVDDHFGIRVVEIGTAI